MITKMIKSMETKIVSFSEKGFNIPKDEMAVLKKWYFKGAINFKANGYTLQTDLYGPCLEDKLWKDVYMMTWLKCFKTLCQKNGVKCGISRNSLLEYKANGFKYKIYPVISTLTEDMDEDLENRLLEEVEKQWQS